MLLDEAMMLLSGGNKPITASALTDLPLPDSPTSATVALRGTLKDTPLTASTLVCLSMRKPTRNWRTSNRISSLMAASFHFGIERVAQRVGEQRERRHQHRHGDRGGRQLPPFTEYQLVLRLVQHAAPRHHAHRHAEAEEAQDHFGLDEADHQDGHLHQRHVADVGEDVRVHAPPVRGAMASAAITYSRALCLMYSARIRRNGPVQPVRPRISTMVVTPFCCSTAATVKIISTDGMAVKTL